MRAERKKITALPVLSQIQQVSTLQNLSLPRRIGYRITLALGLTLIFLLGIGISVLLIVALYSLVIREVNSTEDVVMLSVPIIATFMIVSGFSSLASPQEIKPGDTLARTIRQALRGSCLGGLIGGFVFALIWNLSMQLGALYTQLNTILGMKVRFDEILLYSLLLALSVTPMYIVFQVFNSIAGHLLLYRIAKEEVYRQIS